MENIRIWRCKGYLDYVRIADLVIGIVMGKNCQHGSVGRGSWNRRKKRAKD